MTSTRTSTRTSGDTPYGRTQQAATPAVGLVSLTSGETLPIYHTVSADSSEGVSASGGVSLNTSMPTLLELLERQRVAYTILERPHSDDTARWFRRLAAAWALVSSCAGLFAFLTALSFALDDYWLDPVLGLAGCVFSLVLVATLTLHTREGL